VDVLEMSFFKVMFDKGYKKLRDKYEKCKTCKKCIEIYEPAWVSLKYVFKYFTPVAVTIILFYSCVYYLCLSSSSSPSNSSSSFSNNITLSIEGFFSLIDFDKHHINSIFKIIVATSEYYLYSILFAVLIGIVLEKAIDNYKERKWNPIKNAAYKDVCALSKDISTYIVELLDYKIFIDVDFEKNNNETLDEKIDNVVANFIENTKLDSIDHIDDIIVKDEDIKFEIQIHTKKFKIHKSRFKYGKLEKSVKSKYSELSILQMKYQQYIEPEITTNIIEIQENLTLAEKTISAYNLLPGNKNNQCNYIKYVVFYLLKAAEFSQEASKQSNSKIKTSGNE
jgi:hypothetical protein